MTGFVACLQVVPVPWLALLRTLTRMTLPRAARAVPQQRVPPEFSWQLDFDHCPWHGVRPPVLPPDDRIGTYNRRIEASGTTE